MQDGLVLPLKLRTRHPTCPLTSHHIWPWQREMVMIPDSIVRHPIIKQQYPGYTQIIHFNWRFRCEPSILGTFSLRLSPFNTSGATKGTVPQDCRHQESCNAELQTSNAWNRPNLQNTQWQKTSRTIIDHRHMYLHIYIYMQYNYHISHILIYCCMTYYHNIFIIYIYYYLFIHCRRHHTADRLAAVEPAPSSITKASWNPVNLSKTISAVCRAKHRGTVGKGWSIGVLQNGCTVDDCGCTETEESEE